MESQVLLEVIMDHSILPLNISKSWGFTHITTSPYYSQSNGLAEKSVQLLKRVLNKVKPDPYLGLLEYRNTAIDNVGSPAQLSMSRQLFVQFYLFSPGNLVVVKVVMVFQAHWVHLMCWAQ